ncbi:MAG: glycosyltransferase family 2 protein [Moraxella sp.]|nr:glycosyltransferase family 2 protein [Moraxella sp.]
MSKKQVAVIMPVYNTEEYLHRSIQSVLNQKDIDLEFFIINDGSTDYSENIICYYANVDSRIHFISKKNEGQGIARNIGIKKSNSEFLYFVDSDDYLVGDDTLKLLYNTAKENSLDICSPNVPNQYFEKPLEMLGCIPCKSQFIKSSIVKSNEIFQPDVSSGQDGVFSHLVLAHCQRIGMNKKAHFHYTHAREGSTFAAHLKKSHLVVGIIKKHYDAIFAHYDLHSLWAKNAVRLLNFIEKETINNRIAPHWDNLSTQDKEKIIMILQVAVKRCLENLPKSYKAAQKNLIPLLNTDITSVLNWFNPKEFALNIPFKSENFTKDNITICKYSDKSLEPTPTVTKPLVISSNQSSVKSVYPQNHAVPVQQPLVGNNEVIEVLKRENKILTEKVNYLNHKMDFLSNQMNNLFIQLVSLHNLGGKTLSGGLPDLVVSLTTLPSRLPVVHLAVESIFQQSILPSKIVLWVSDAINLNDYITPELLALQKRGLEICQVPDVGPHTKLMYAYERFSNHSIITVDDDIIYPNNMIQYLWKEHCKFPKAIVANWARELSFDTEGLVQGVRKGKLLTPPILQEEIEQKNKFEARENLLAFPYGTGGVLYSAGSLDKDFNNIKLFSKICPKEDDIWFKAMSLKKGTKVVTTNLGIDPKHHCLLGSQDIALRHHNHGDNQNEKQMRAVFDNLGLYKFIK